MKTTRAKENKIIILDSNIVWYAYQDKYKRQVFSEYIANLITNGSKIALSYVSFSEIIARARKSQEQEVYKALRSYKLFDIDEKVLITVAYYTRLYDQMKISKQQIDLADKIISATAFLTNSSILTANLDDFPRSLFIEKEIHNLKFRTGDNGVICVCLLHLDITETRRYFNNLQ